MPLDSFALAGSKTETPLRYKSKCRVCVNESRRLSGPAFFGKDRTINSIEPLSKLEIETVVPKSAPLTADDFQLVLEVFSKLRSWRDALQKKAP